MIEGAVDVMIDVESKEHKGAGPGWLPKLIHVN